MKYACILPVKNEENTIEKVINELSSKFSQNDNINLIIVSDSTDRTDEIIKNMNKPNISLLDGDNFGLGFSVLKGIKYALKFDPKYLFTIDTDGQVDLNEITLFLNESKKDFSKKYDNLKNEEEDNPVKPMDLQQKKESKGKVMAKL